MFRTSIAGHTARGIAVGALVFSLTATALGGSASAAPLTVESGDCSTLAHDRNAAVHLLHDAFKAFRGDLKDLARQARQMDKDGHKSGEKMATDARHVVASAMHELTEIFKDAHEDIQDAADLGQACKDRNEHEDEAKTTTTTTPSAPSPMGSTSAGSPGDSTAGGHTFDTSGLSKKFKDIVDKAIKDMQAVVDAATKAVQALDIAADNKDKADEEKVEADLNKAKNERAQEKEKEQEHRDKDKAKDKAQNKHGKDGHDRKGDHEKDSSKDNDRD